MKQKWRRLWIGSIVAILLVSGLLSFLSSSVHAQQYDITVNLPTDTNTAKGADGRYYSRHATLTPSVDLMQFYSDNAIDPSTVESVSLVAPSGVSVSVTCTTTSVNFAGPISGTKVDLKSSDSLGEAGYFDWWRNNPGYHGYWWSYDLEGETIYGDQEQDKLAAGDHSSIAPRDYPGGDYPHTWNPLDGSSKVFNSTGGAYAVSGLSSQYVVLDTTKLDKTMVSRSGNIAITGVSIDANAFSATVSTLNGPFDYDSKETVIQEDNPRGIRWAYSFDFYLYGYTYVYDWGQWKANITFKTITPPPTSSPSPSPTPDNGPEVITGDFTLDKTVMNFGESNGANPVNVKVSGGNGSKLVEFGFTFTQGGLSWSSYGPATAPSAQGFSGPPYPAGMGGGTVDVTMKIKTSLGTEKIVGPKSFEIMIPPNNNPPVWKGAWFQGGNSFGYPPVTQVMLGDYVDLGIVHDPTETPNTPYDPDGDDIIYTWDFAGSSDPWIQAIGTKAGDWNHDEHYSLIKANVLGTHTVKVSAIDRRGASGGTQDVTIEVMDPNAPPIAVITLPPKVVEGRTFTPDIHGNYSYSPIKSRTITGYNWTGKQALYPTAGDYPISLIVTDNAGNVSAPAFATLPVQPDLPPIPQLDNPGIGIRNSPVYFKDTSYSPDGDPIATHTVDIAYDSNNDGSFANESYSPVTLDGNGNFTYTASKVGKYDIRIYLKEGVGYQKDATGHFGFEIVNDAPEADYYVEGSDFAPPAINQTTFTSSQLMNDSNWKNSTLSKPFNPAKAYTLNTTDDTLETGKSPLAQGKALTGVTQTQDFQWSIGSSKNTLGDMIKPYLFDNGSEWTSLKTTTPNQAPSRSSYYVNIKDIDVENNKIWYRGGSHFIWEPDYWVNDYIYRISDIENDAIQGKGPFRTFKASPIYQSSVYTNLLNEPNPPSNVWTYPPKKLKNRVNGYATYQLNGVVRPIDYDEDHDKSTDFYGFPSFGGDYQGNRYQLIANGSDSFGNLYYRLEKKDSSGNTLWTTDNIHTRSLLPVRYVPISYRPNYNPVVCVSDDNTKIVIRENNLLTLYDNLTGAKIGVINANTNNIPRLVDDKIIYIKTVGSYQDATENILYIRNLFSYDINTGVATDFGTVYKGVLEYYSPYFTISSDKKILLQTYSYENYISDSYLSTYDLSGALLSKILLPKYNGWGAQYTGTAPIIMEDGAIALDLCNYDPFLSRNIGYVLVLKGPVDQTKGDIYSFGQYYNHSVTMADGEATTRIKLNYDNFTNEPSIGISARMADNKNMYRLEVTAKKTRLVKMVNGVKTVLAEANYPLQFRQWYDLKLKVRGTVLKGYINGVPVVEANDSTFTSGLTGPYSEIEYSLIKGFSITSYQANTGITKNTAIVGTPLNYIKSYSDTENDPAIDPLTKWTYTHTNPNKFLDAGDGYSSLSAYHGQTVTTPNPVLDKVGEYKLDYQVCDDPGPPGYKFPIDTFAGYRKYSDVASHTIIIHRRPIAAFSLFLNADNTVGWNDTSYDPDRWLSPWNYSTEPTGINYQATRGIIERKMNFTTPSGETRSGQLIKPDQTGTYTVRLAVKDEYGAWSDWAETTIYVSIPIPNNKPFAALTFPNGTQANPSYVSLKPTLTWNQSDPDPGTIFTQFEVLVKDEYGNTYESKTSNYYTSNPSWNWTLDNTLDPGKKYWAQVRVWDDGGLVSDWSNIGWMVTNTVPIASMADPSGTQANPTIVATTKPTFTWNQTDSDAGNIFTQAEIQVTNEANTVTLYDKVIGQWTSQTWNSFQADQDLPAGQKLRVRVRVWDNYGAASNWSAQTWFMINRAPVADFDWSPKPVWEGDTVQLMNRSSDPDGDSLSYQWEVTGPDGVTDSYNTTDVTRGFLLAGPYTVKLTVSDGIASSQVTKVIQAQPLTIQSDVEHTPEWLANHQKLQHNTTVRPKDFYSGEIFVVHTRSSPAPVSRAEAWIDTTGLDGTKLNINTVLAQSVNDGTLFTGELFDDRLLSLTEGLPKGIQTIHFRITYANGVIREEDVPVNIIGNVREFVQVHRVK